MTRQQSVAVIHRDEIIEQVSKGAMLKAIATKLGVTPGALSQQLHDDPEYRKAREVGAEVRLEEQFEAITGAREQESISRAREGFRAAAWFAEREFPHRWGQKVEHQVTLSLSKALQEIAERRQRELDGVSSTQQSTDAVVLPPIDGDYVKLAGDSGDATP